MRAASRTTAGRASTGATPSMLMTLYVLATSLGSTARPSWHTLSAPHAPAATAAATLGRARVDLLGISLELAPQPLRLPDHNLARARHFAPLLLETHRLLLRSQPRRLVRCQGNTLIRQRAQPQLTREALAAAATLAATAATAGAPGYEGIRAPRLSGRRQHRRRLLARWNLTR